LFHICKFYLNKLKIGDIHGGEGYAYVKGAGVKWEISVPSSQFCYESKTALKKSSIKKKNPGLVHGKITESFQKLKDHSEHYITKQWKCWKVDVLRIQCLSRYLDGIFLLTDHLEINESLLAASYLTNAFNVPAPVFTYHRLSDITQKTDSHWAEKSLD